MNASYAKNYPNRNAKRASFPQPCGILLLFLFVMVCAMKIGPYFVITMLCCVDSLAWSP